MPTVTFLPPGKSTQATVASGASLLDAATAAGVAIVAPCGGEGVCGECRVRIEAGTLDQEPSGALSLAELAAGWVLACHSRVIGDVTVRVPETLLAVAEAGAQIVTTEPSHAEPQGRREENGPKELSSAGFASPREHLTPLVTTKCIEVAPPALDNPLCDLERLEQALRAAGGPRETACGLGVLRDLAAALRSAGGRVTVSVGQPFPCPLPAAGGGWGEGTVPAEILRVEPGRRAFGPTGLAIDIGTTTCAVQLVDLERGHVLDTACEYNGQIVRGLDVISRINYAKVPARREELRNLVLQTLNTLIEQLCARALPLPPPASGRGPGLCSPLPLREGVGGGAAAIDCATVVGNTTMIHLLLGLDPEYIRLEPYTPTFLRPPLLRARDVGLGVNPEGYVLFAPAVGSYVGGDIAAGLLRTALATESEEVRLFLDIGTNGEIVLGSREWLMACACSAGPAFEGGGIRCGMRAAKGAVERVRLEPSPCPLPGAGGGTGAGAVLGVVGGGKPRGVCGSGMIDLLAELWAAKLLGPSGRFDRARCGALVRPVGAATRDLAYVIAPGALTENGQDLVITESEIQNLLRTKAAVYSACALMLRHAGLTAADVAQVYVAGGFGRYLDLRKAILIGMLPDLPLERFTYLGNSALAGAREMLLKREARRKVQELADRITYLELNVVPAYMEEYTAALFLPHTDLSRFPSAREVP